MTTRDELDAWFAAALGTPTTVETEFLAALNGTKPDTGAAALASARADHGALLAQERARIAEERAQVARERAAITTKAPADMTPAEWFRAHVNDTEEIA